MVDNAERPVPDEDPAIGHAMRQILALADGTTIDGDRLLIVIGRRPATDELHLDTVDAVLGPHGEIEVDARCRAGQRLWAIGDVTAVALYTHTAIHQARVVVDEILGRPGHDMTPDALPRAVFTDPPLAAAGLTKPRRAVAGCTS